jgi:serine/threonine protein kinase
MPDNLHDTKPELPHVNSELFSDILEIDDNVELDDDLWSEIDVNNIDLQEYDLDDDLWGEADENENPIQGSQFSLREKYEIIELIGHGGQAKVFKIKERRNLRRVLAVKVIDKNKNTLSRMEISNMSRSYHPNIIKIYSVAQSVGQLFIFMEYFHGVTLYEEIPNLKYEEKMVIICEILDGLRYMHGQKIVHLDMKPKNIMISRIYEKFVVKIIDLGVSTRTVGHGQILGGTDAYKSPEHIKNNAPSIGMDLWSISVVFLQMLSNEINPMNVIKDKQIKKVTMGKHIEEKLKKLKIKTLNPFLRRSMRKSFHMDPNCRYNSSINLKNAILISHRKFRSIIYFFVLNFISMFFFFIGFVWREYSNEYPLTNQDKITMDDINHEKIIESEILSVVNGQFYSGQINQARNSFLEIENSIRNLIQLNKELQPEKEENLNNLLYLVMYYRAYCDFIDIISCEQGDIDNCEYNNSFVHQNIRSIKNILDAGVPNLSLKNINIKEDYKARVNLLIMWINTRWSSIDHRDLINEWTIFGKKYGCNGYYQQSNFWNSMLYLSKGNKEKSMIFANLMVKNYNKIPFFCQIKDLSQKEKYSLIEKSKYIVIQDFYYCNASESMKLDSRLLACAVMDFIDPKLEKTEDCSDYEYSDSFLKTLQLIQSNLAGKGDQLWYFCKK